MKSRTHRFYFVKFVYETIHEEIVSTEIQVLEENADRARTSGTIRAMNVCDDFDAKFIGIQSVTENADRKPVLLVVS